MRTRVVGLALCVSVAARAAPAPSARSVLASIRTNGAKKTIADLDADNQLEAVFTKIGTGDNEWVALAPLLAPGADGAASEGLGIMLAQALPVSPVAVLRVVTTDQQGTLSVNRVCGIPFVESPPGADEAYRKKALRAVVQVTAPGLVSVRDKCLARLTS